MTINTTNNRASYLGNSATTAFSFPYKLAQAADIIVLDTVIATGVSVTRTLGVDYMISGTQDAQGAYPGGCTVNMVAAPVTGDRLTLYRDPQMVQDVLHVDNDPMPAASIDDPLDLLTMIAQRNRDLLVRSMRQPDGDPSGLGMILPPVAVRANKALVFAGDGSIDVGDQGSVPSVVIPSIPNGPKALFRLRLNSGGTAYELADPTKSSDYFINILDPKYGSSTGSGGDDTAAFTDALADCASTGFPLFLPPAPSGYYNVGDVVTPNGVAIFSINAAQYSTVYSKVVVRGLSGATRVFSLSSGMASRIGIYMAGFDINGLDKTIVGIGSYGVNGGPFLTLRDMGVRNCLYGLGDTHYIQAVNAVACSFFGNVIGAANLIDGTVTACNFSSNDSHGVSLLAGANNNTFTACRWEFNVGDGMRCFDAIQNIIHGTFDHNYQNGLWISNSGGASRTNQILVTDGTIFKRNGRNNVANQRAHIHIEGNPDYVSIGKIVTLTGKNDDGSGILTPAISIDMPLTGGNSTILKIEGADLRGNTTGGAAGAITSSASAATLRVNNCLGFDDFSTQGLQTLAISNRGVFNNSSGAHINNAATTSFVIANLPALTTFSQARYRLDFGWRNAGDGSFYGSSVLFSLNRNSGSAVIVFANAFGTETGSAGLAVIGTGTANKVSITADTILSDGSGLTLKVNNQLAASADLGNFDYTLRPA